MCAACVAVVAGIEEEGADEAKDGIWNRKSRNKGRRNGAGMEGCMCLDVSEA